MRIGVGDDTSWQAALGTFGVTTAVLARFDFTSGTQFISTLPFPLAVTGTGDTLCDGNTFQPIANGVPISIGDNQFSYSGSEALTLGLAVPQPMTAEMAACASDSTEWQGRTATIWRFVVFTPATATTPMAYDTVRIRSGSMDDLNITNDGQNHVFALTIEGHAAMISNATNSTYQDQWKFDAADTSQKYANSIANNPSGPGGGSAGGSIGGGGGGSVYSGGGGGSSGGSGGYRQQIQ